MKTLCGIDCAECSYKESCKGCAATNGSPFGGKCIAAEYVKAGGLDAYRAFKEKLTEEVNQILTSLGFPTAEKLFELVGHYVNLEYALPSGEKVKFLKDDAVYLGCQVELPGNERCAGVIADTAFILVCTYGENGSSPEIVLFKAR